MKEVREFYDRFATCREHDIPLCADACPFRLDILDLRERITKKRFNAAYKALRDAVVFPGIVAEACPAYCQNHCIRKIIDESLQIRLLEKSVVNLATRKDPNAYNLPAREAKIAVIGAGVSGMAFALKMAARKYDVTVFEKSDTVGGSLAEIMDAEIYTTEFDLQFKNEKYRLCLNTEAVVDSETGVVTATGEYPGTCNDFAVIYVATGKGGSSFGVPLPEEGSDGSITGGCTKAGSTGIFLGGSLLGRDLMFALADGNNMAAAADDFIKADLLNYPQNPAPSKCVANEDNLTASPTINPGGADKPSDDSSAVYTEDEAAAEAERCIKCRCDACESYCDLIKFYKKWPVKMRDELFLSVKPAGSLVHKCPSRKYIAACTDCRIMEEECPDNIPLCSMVKAARYQMHAVEKMPAAYKQYFIRDMEHANGAFASIVKSGSDSSGCKSPGTQGASPINYVFFPGCNLGALNPDYVIKPYRWLVENYPGTGLLLKCCGIPLDWSGNEKEHLKAIDGLRSDWKSLGKPVLVTACMSCHRHIREQLPEIETVTIYELLAGHGPEELQRLNGSGPYSEGAAGGITYSIFDPCSARGIDAVQEAIRTVAAGIGLNAENLPKDDRHGCCGFGGQGSMAQPEFADFVAEARISATENPYIVYCSNCRDIFTGRGRKAPHIFDLLFGIDPDCTAPAPGMTDRRNNRSILKERLLREFWGEEMTDKPEAQKYELTMSEELRSKVNALRILDENICTVIERAERTGRRTRNPENGHYKAYSEIGAITLWVEYGVPASDPAPGGSSDCVSESGGSSDCIAASGGCSGNVREIYNIYTHRMQIKLEPVFNGHVIDE